MATLQPHTAVRLRPGRFPRARYGDGRVGEVASESRGAPGWYWVRFPGSAALKWLRGDWLELVADARGELAGAEEVKHEGQ